MVRRLGTGALTLLVLVVIVAVAAVPLLFVYKSTCKVSDGREDRYSFVPPWDDLPSECRNHRRGIELVGDELGL